MITSYVNNKPEDNLTAKDIKYNMPALVLEGSTGIVYLVTSLSLREESFKGVIVNKGSMAAERRIGGVHTCALCADEYSLFEGTITLDTLHEKA